MPHIFMGNARLTSIGTLVKEPRRLVTLRWVGFGAFGVLRTAQHCSVKSSNARVNPLEMHSNVTLVVLEFRLTRFCLLLGSKGCNY